MLGKFLKRILAAVAMSCVLAAAACGGGDDASDTSPAPSAERPNTPAGGSVIPALATRAADEGGSGGASDATANFTLGGKDFELTGGKCTEVEAADGTGLSVSMEMFEAGIGILEGQTPADSGAPITDAVVTLIADGVPYASTGTTDELTFTVDADLNGGDFTGTIDSPVTPGSQPESISGAFSCG